MSEFTIITDIKKYELPSGPTSEADELAFRLYCTLNEVLRNRTESTQYTHTNLTADLKDLDAHVEKMLEGAKALIGRYDDGFMRMTMMRTTDQSLHFRTSTIVASFEHRSKASSRRSSKTKNLPPPWARIS